MRRLVVLWLVGLVAVIGLAGCGDDDDDTDATGATTTVADDDGGEEEDDEEFTGEGSGDFCDTAKRFDEEFDDAFTNATTPADTERVFNAARDALDTLEDEAPGEIKADVQTLSRAFGQLIDALDDVGYDVTKLTPEQQQLISNPDIQAASERLERYGERVCGIPAE